jgi:hypothetical protein
MLIRVLPDHLFAHEWGFAIMAPFGLIFFVLLFSHSINLKFAGHL